MSAPEVCAPTLTPEQCLRVLTSALEGLHQRGPADLAAEIDALALLAYQGQSSTEDTTEAVISDAQEAASAAPPSPILWDTATRLEEAAAVLRGVLDGLEMALDIATPPERTIRVLVERFETELAVVDTEWHALYEAANRKTAVAS